MDCSFMHISRQALKLHGCQNSTPDWHISSSVEHPLGWSSLDLSYASNTPKMLRLLQTTHWTGLKDQATYDHLQAAYVQRNENLLHLKFSKCCKQPVATPKNTRPRTLILRSKSNVKWSFPVVLTSNVSQKTTFFVYEQDL